MQLVIKKVTTPETKNNKNQTYKFTAPRIGKVNSVTVNTGAVNVIDWENTFIEVELKDGEYSRRVQTGGSYTPPQTKYVENQTSSNYNSGGYSGVLERYWTGQGSYTPSDTKYVEGQTSASYNSGGYSGTLTQYVYSEETIPSQEKYVTNQTSQNYSDSQGFKGTLQKYHHSGEITPADTKTVSVGIKTLVGSREYSCSPPSPYFWSVATSSKDISAPRSQSYSSGGYSGTLSFVNNGTNLRKESPYEPGSVCGVDKSGQRFTAYYYRDVNYSGEVTRPERDERVYRYQGNVTKPSETIKTYRYKGEVTKPAVDTRVYRYRGDVIKPAIDTRTWDHYYSYQISFDYVDGLPPTMREVPTPDGLIGYEGAGLKFDLESYDVDTGETITVYAKYLGKQYTLTTHPATTTKKTSIHIPFKDKKFTFEGSKQTGVIPEKTNQKMEIWSIDSKGLESNKISINFEMWYNRMPTLTVNSFDLDGTSNESILKLSGSVKDDDDWDTIGVKIHLNDALKYSKNDIGNPGSWSYELLYKEFKDGDNVLKITGHDDKMGEDIKIYNIKKSGQSVPLKKAYSRYILDSDIKDILNLVIWTQSSSEYNEKVRILYDANDKEEELYMDLQNRAEFTDGKIEKQWYAEGLKRDGENYRIFLELKRDNNEPKIEMFSGAYEIRGEDD